MGFWAQVLADIYVGQLEQATYDPAGLAKFDRMREEGYLDLVYENEKVRIYRHTT